MLSIVLVALIIIVAILARFVGLSTKDMEKKRTGYTRKMDLADISSYEKERIQEKINDVNKEIKKRKNARRFIVPSTAILCVIVLGFSMLAIVPTGYTGIKTTFGKVEDDTLSSGVNFVLPWQSVVKMDNRTQKVQMDTQAFSSDIQQVEIKMSVNYNIDQETAQVLYKTVGTEYYDNIMFPRIQENTKAVFSQYTAESLVEKRNQLSDEVARTTAEDMKPYGINIVSVSIENIDFTDAFTDAVEAKQVAAQKKLTAETEQAQRTMEEKAAAERAIIAEEAKAKQAVIAANADLEVVQIQAEASLYAGQREAEMNQRIAEALTEPLISYYWIKQWNGELPDTMLGKDTSIMLTLDSQKDDGQNE